MSDEPPALAYVEATLANAYRKEIDQEENVWRSLPFFAATLALQIAALFQMIDKLPSIAGWTGLLAVALLAAAGLLTMVALTFLAASIYPARFDYVTAEPYLLEYTRQLVDYEQSDRNRSADSAFSALATLKGIMANQYACAANHNRRINERRGRWRSIAGLAAVGSVFMTILLVGASYAHYLSTRVEQEHSDAEIRATAARPPAGDFRADPARRHQ